LKNETYDKRIHVLIFESESHSAIQELLRSVSKVLPPNVNILNYQVDDSLFRIVLASLREGVSLTGFGKNRGGR